VTFAAAPGVVRIVQAGDSALVLEYPARIDQAINERAVAVAEVLRSRWNAILRDVVVGYCTVTVYFDPLRVDAPWLEAEMRVAAGQAAETPEGAGTVVDVPVCYGGEFGPDLDGVAAFASCTGDEVIALHTGCQYRVYLVGFVPGFAYLAEVDRRIAAPRRSTPRAAVPAGSVAIASGQTGVYPSETPGGWNIIGRTPLKPYDPSRSDPFLFHVGDNVQFRPISRDEFDRVS
jgi:inhibitor of KinA